MKKEIITCDLCRKEKEPNEYFEYTLIKKGFFLAQTVSILDICNDCAEKFKEKEAKIWEQKISKKHKKNS